MKQAASDVTALAALSGIGRECPELTRARAAFNELWHAVGGQAEHFGERRGLHERLEVFAMSMQELGYAMAKHKDGMPPHDGFVSPGSDAMSLVNELRRATRYTRTLACALDEQLQCQTYSTLAALLDAAAWEGYDKIYHSMRCAGGALFDDFDGATKVL